jgi:hypothetical protein
MELTSLSYRRDRGWSVPLPVGLDSPRTLALAFGARAFSDHPAPLDELTGAFGRSVVAGCSTAGEILGNVVGDDSLVVAIARFAEADLALASAAIRSMDDSAAAGEQLGRQLAPRAPRAVLVFSAGVAVNGSELVRGLVSTLPAGTVVAGGLAGDGDRFERTWVLVGGQPRAGYVTAVALCGPVDIATGSRGGWDAFGPERRITRSRGNVLHELDGKPALALYKDYLGDLAGGLPATALLFPLAIRPRDGDDGQLVRTVLAVDEATQSMTFAGDVPQGVRARLMRSSHERLVEGAAHAAADAAGATTVRRLHGAAAARSDDGPTLALAISCVGRRLVLGQRVEEEVEATLDALPAATTQIGFYSYGEISPSEFAPSDLHNQTMTLTTIREAAA